MPSKNLTDSELIGAIFHDDEKAFNILFERHWSRVYAIAYRYVKDEESSLEIVHNIFLNIWNRRHEGQISSFKSYVATAASYHGIRKRQTNRTAPITYVEDYDYAEDESYHVGFGADSNAGETRLMKEELELRVDTLLEELPKRCREIYVMSRRQELSISEIAEKLDISKRTVENQLTAALKHLRGSLKYMLVLFWLC